jgi:hypothetical protein
MKPFTESDHSRAGSGEFRDKPQSAPELPRLKLDPSAPIANYTRTEESVAAIWHFNDADELHRIDGPAVERDGEDNHYFLNGMEIFPPDTSGLDLDTVTNDGTQTWTASNRIVFVVLGKHTIFTEGGEFHRDGAPAIIVDGGTDAWMQRGRKIENPIPAAPTVTIDEEADTTTTTGSRYDEAAEASDVAKELRKDIKQFIGAGVLSEHAGVTYKVSVRPQRRQDRTEITITVDGLARDRVIRDNDESDAPLHADEATEMLRALRSLGQARNKVTAHHGTDSISSPFWFDANITTAH